ncbi:E3 ubiquitin-protein ligase RNF25 [Dendropsophus ebraccatus]|uniref:E3 ubiquitin-protein ligase RNF25 n=1 Tax=Dendropsophus ebraccatus TaxID=150705 RepID=UPI0038310919
MAEEPEDGSLSQELEVLQSIYLDELEVCQQDRLLLLRITIHPTTGDDPESQYVRMTLQLSIPPQYPGEPPEITVANPRGLGDEQIESIIDALRKMASQSIGCPNLYALIEKGKEMLTASNLPRGHCVICLYEFQEEDSLTKTQCFHHFHSYCLGRYVQHCLDASHREESVECPVCRESLNLDFTKLQAAAPPQQQEELYVPDLLTLEREKELRQVYERQLANGGIIDLEAEKNRFFISIQETSTNEHETQVLQAEQVSVDQVSPPPETGLDHNQPPLVSKHRGGGRTHLCGSRPPRSDHPDSQPWRDSRGWTARGRWRPDARRVWRAEATSIDETPARGRVMARSCRNNGTVQASPRAASDSSEGGKLDP